MTTENINTLIFIGCLLGVVGLAMSLVRLFKAPTRADRVYDRIQDWKKDNGFEGKNMGDVYDEDIRWVYLVDNLMEEFYLTKDQARTCMFHDNDRAWFNKQSYLREKESTYIYGKIRGR